jgi:tetratricopeptide (TPR) repeat protein
VLLSRIAVWVLAVAGVLTVSSGCSSTNKIGAAAKSQQPEASATPGSAEFSSGSELKNPVKVHLAYASWHEAEGNLVEARNSYDRVLEKSPKNIEALLGLARLDIQLGRVEDAEKRLMRAQKIAPKSPQVAAARGQYYAAGQEWPHALEQMRAARILAPYDPIYAYQLGVVQAKMGDTSAALTSFTEAVGAAEAHYNLGVILYEQGNVAAAEDHLQKALAQKPDLAQAQKLLTTVRQQRYGTKTNVAKAAAVNGGSENFGSVQPAAYSEPAAR